METLHAKIAAYLKLRDEMAPAADERDDAERGASAQAIIDLIEEKTQEDLDMEAVGRSFMNSFEQVVLGDGMFKGYTPAEDPVELVLDMAEALDVYTRPGGFFSVGDLVEKFTGDYQLPGEVRSAFYTNAGKVRFVIEHKPGFLHIYAPENLRLVASEVKPEVIGTTYDGVDVLAPAVPSQNFTCEEARSAVQAAVAAISQTTSSEPTP